MPGQTRAGWSAELDFLARTSEIYRDVTNKTMRYCKTNITSYAFIFICYFLLTKLPVMRLTWAIKCSFLRISSPSANPGLSRLSRWMLYWLRWRHWQHSMRHCWFFPGHRYLLRFWTHHVSWISCIPPAKKASQLVTDEFVVMVTLLHEIHLFALQMTSTKHKFYVVKPKANDSNDPQITSNHHKWLLA